MRMNKFDDEEECLQYLIDHNLIIEKKCDGCRNIWASFLWNYLINKVILFDSPHSPRGSEIGWRYRYRQKHLKKKLLWNFIHIIYEGKIMPHFIVILLLFTVSLFLISLDNSIWSWRSWSDLDNKDHFYLVELDFDLRLLYTS